MAILKRTIIFEDDLVNGTATLNLSSGEVKSIIFKNKTIEFFLNFNVDKAAFDEKKGFKDNPEISKKISDKTDELEELKSELEKLVAEKQQQELEELREMLSNSGYTISDLKELLKDNQKQ